MKKLLVIFLFISSTCFAYDHIHSVPAGRFKAIPILVSCDNCTYDITYRINGISQGAYWVHSFGLVLFGEEPDTWFKIGGTKSVTSIFQISPKFRAYFHVGERGKEEKQYLEHEIQINSETRYTVSWNEAGQITVDGFGLVQTLQLAFKPVRAEFTISGLDFEVTVKNNANE